MRWSEGRVRGVSWILSSVIPRALRRYALNFNSRIKASTSAVYSGELVLSRERVLNPADDQSFGHLIDTQLRKLFALSDWKRFRRVRARRERVLGFHENRVRSKVRALLAIAFESLRRTEGDLGLDAAQGLDQHNTGILGYSGDQNSSRSELRFQIHFTNAHVFAVDHVDQFSAS